LILFEAEFANLKSFIMKSSILNQVFNSDFLLENEEFMLFFAKIKYLLNEEF
jgi:hypothetical protein